MNTQCLYTLDYPGQHDSEVMKGFQRGKQRKLEIKLMHEETFIAKHEKLRENREKVAETLEEKKNLNSYQTN